MGGRRGRKGGAQNSASHGKVLLLVEVEVYKNCRRLRQAHLDKDFPKKPQMHPVVLLGFDHVFSNQVELLCLWLLYSNIFY